MELGVNNIEKQQLGKSIRQVETEKQMGMLEEEEKLVDGVLEAIDKNIKKYIYTATGSSCTTNRYRRKKSYEQHYKLNCLPEAKDDMVTDLWKKVSRMVLLMQFYSSDKGNVNRVILEDTRIRSYADKQIFRY